MLDENTERNAKGLVEMFAEYVEKIDRINHMFIYGRAMYSAWDIQELRYKWCGEVYRKLAKEPVKPTPDEMKKLEDRMDLEIARELGRHEAFQFLARHILDPSEERMSDILFIYSDCVIQDFQGFVHEAFCQHDWFMKLMGAVDELKAVWEALFRTLSVNYDNIPELNRAKLAMCNLHDLYGMCLTGTANEEQVRMYHQRVETFGYKLAELSAYLSKEIVIDLDRLDYGEVSRIPLGRYRFEDVCEGVPDEDLEFDCEKPGWLFYINDTGGSKMENKYLQNFDERRFEEIKNLNDRYQRFWYLVGSRQIDDAMEIQLPDEDPERKMRGIVFKIFDCLEKLKLFARDSIDKYGALRDEAFRQFDRRSSDSVLSNPFDLMRADYYRNLAYVSGTDSEFSVIREPLQFFNQCLDELFSWLVKDVKCKFFESAWDAWRQYWRYCETAGYARPDEDEDPAVAKRINELERKMILAFNDLSEKTLPRYSSEPMHYQQAGKAIKALLKDGSPLLSAETGERLPVCLDRLFEYTNACTSDQKWGMFGNPLFIRVVTKMAEITDYEIYEVDANVIEGKWKNLRSALDTFLTCLRETAHSLRVERFIQWLAENRTISRQKPGSSIKCLLSAEIVAGLAENCKETVLDLCREEDLDAAKKAYAGIIPWNYEDYDFLELLRIGRSMTEPQVELTCQMDVQITRDIKYRGKDGEAQSDLPEKVADAVVGKMKEEKLVATSGKSAVLKTKFLAAVKQWELAALLGYKNADTVRKWESGERAAPYGYHRELRIRGGIDLLLFINTFRREEGIRAPLKAIRDGKIVDLSNLTEEDADRVLEYVRKSRKRRNQRDGQKATVTE